MTAEKKCEAKSDHAPAFHVATEVKSVPGAKKQEDLGQQWNEKETRFEQTYLESALRECKNKSVELKKTNKNKKTPKTKILKLREQFLTRKPTAHESTEDKLL